MKIIYNSKEFDIKVCNNFKDRLLGLMFKKNFNYGLCFPRCNSIHTFFMRQNIDVFMADKNNRITYIKKNLKPFKIILPQKNVYYTYEFGVNQVDFKIGEIIKKS